MVSLLAHHDNSPGCRMNFQILPPLSNSCVAWNKLLGASDQFTSWPLTWNNSTQSPCMDDLRLVLSMQRALSK